MLTQTDSSGSSLDWKGLSGAGVSEAGALRERKHGWLEPIGLIAMAMAREIAELAQAQRFTNPPAA